MTGLAGKRILLHLYRLVRTHISWAGRGGVGGPRASRSWGGPRGCRVLLSPCESTGQVTVSVLVFSLLQWQSVCAPQSRRLDTRPPGLIAQSCSICFMSRHLEILILRKVLANSFFKLLLRNMTFTLLNYFNHFLLSTKDITFQRGSCGQSFGQNPVALKIPFNQWIADTKQGHRVLIRRGKEFATPMQSAPAWIKLTRENLWEKLGRLSFRFLK